MRATGVGTRDRAWVEQMVTRSRSVIAILVMIAMVVVAVGCGVVERAADVDPTGPTGPTGRDAGAEPFATGTSAPPADAPSTDDGHALVVAWARDATHAARNGPGVLLRFALGSREPGLATDPGCVPGFAGVLRQDPEALAEASVTRQDDGTFRVRGTDLRVDVVVRDGRVGHLDGCGGPTSLHAEAEAEQRRRAAEQAAADLAEREAARAEREAAELAEREAAAAREAGTATDDGGIPSAEPLDDRVEVFPRDRTPPPPD